MFHINKPLAEYLNIHLIFVLSFFYLFYLIAIVYSYVILVVFINVLTRGLKFLRYFLAFVIGITMGFALAFVPSYSDKPFISIFIGIICVSSLLY